MSDRTGIKRFQSILSNHARAQLIISHKTPKLKLKMEKRTKTITRNFSPTFISLMCFILVKQQKYKKNTG